MLCGVFRGVVLRCGVMCMMCILGVVVLCMRCVLCYVLRVCRGMYDVRYVCGVRDVSDMYGVCYV